MAFKYSEVDDGNDQLKALQILFDLTVKGTKTAEVIEAARAIVNECPSRDDHCEVQAVYAAVKHGSAAVPGLHNGVRYQRDTLFMDTFTAPDALLRACERGACAEDCDGHAALIAAMLFALGYVAGLRIWRKATSPNFEHVYAVVKLPKSNPKEWVALDTTVTSADVGWEPPNGKTKTIYLKP